MANLFVLMASISATASTPAAPSDLPTAPELIATIRSDVQPYVDTRNFSGAILMARDGKPLFAKAYGFANQQRSLRNDIDTRFHVASMSMQFTAAAILRLVDGGKLTLDTPIAEVIADYPNGRNITIRHLLTQTSGIADLNDQPGYDAVLQQPQTPLTLVNKVRDLPALRPPGTYVREEHSAYNLLALIIERKSGLSFADAVQELVFRPLGMRHSGIDDGRPIANAALGYQPKGSYEVEPADRIEWSAKAGNASAYTTVGDELLFVRGLFDDRFLSPGLRETMFNLGARVGYGWFKTDSQRFGEPVYSMNGRSPGFASAVVYVPAQRLFVAAFSNIYASVPTDMAYDIAALMLGKPYERVSLQTEVARDSLIGLPARFQFPHDFYQPDALVRVESSNGEVTLRWPKLGASALIPLGKDRYMDRSYWVPVEIRRDATGTITALQYDRFIGKRSDAK